MARAWRQPIPAWAQRRNAEREAEREADANDRMGNIFGLDDTGEPRTEPASELPAVPEPVMAHTERYSVSREFLLAGRAVFTLAGKTSRYTFRILKKEPDAGSQYGPSFFVYVLTGPKPAPADVDADDDKHRSPYTYIGVLNTNTGEVRITKGCPLDHRHPAVLAIQWAMPKVWAGRDLPQPAALYHEGRCGRCARPLTDPDSILSGFGPECRAVLGIKLPTKRGATNG